MFGLNACEDGDVIDCFGELVVGDGVEFGSFDDVAGESDLAGDGARGFFVVAGDHLHGDAGAGADAEGVLDFVAGRVFDADEA